MNTTTVVTTFEQNVKDKLRDIVADLIPPDRYEALVRAAVKDFETKDLPALVKAELTVKYQAAIAEELGKPEYQGMWVNGQQYASEGIKAMIVEAGPQILAGMIGSVCQQMLFDFQNRVSRL